MLIYDAVTHPRRRPARRSAGGFLEYNFAMAKIDKLLKKAQDTPQNISFADLCHLAEAYNFVWLHGEGSHRVYGRANVREVLVFQPGKNGQAKTYQVKQLLRLIDQYGLEV
jgi:hypothetical protein